MAEEGTELVLLSLAIDAAAVQWQWQLAKKCLGASWSARTGFHTFPRKARIKKSVWGWAEEC